MAEPRPRALASVLFTDIERSTARAAELGDRAWRTQLDAHDALARRLVEEHGGRFVKATGDGVVAVFESPGRAVACALAFVAAAAEKLALPLRAGVHSGECEFRGDDIAGIAVHVAARVCDAAAAGQTLVSRTVRDLLAGDDLSYSSAGTHTLRGVPGRWPLFSVSAERPAPKPRVKKAAPKAVPRRSRTMPADVATVVLVDDHPLWRQTLRAVIESDGAAKVVGDGTDGADALPLVREHAPSVLVMDMDLPTMHGIDATAQVLGAQPADGAGVTRVLVLSSSDDPEIVLAAVRAGAAGYLLKTAEAAEIRTAVRRVAAGELVFPSQLSEVVLRGLRGDDDRSGGSSGLTAREIDVLDLMAEGLSNPAIGKRLYLSPKTVEAHIGAIFSKLGIEPTDDVNRRVRAVVAHLSSRNASARRRGSPPPRP
jgi:DNA-binding NarL/FixJ family response regulator/class 3 adenylate cyclase